MDTGLAKAAGGMRRSSRVAMSISSVLPGMQREERSHQEARLLQGSFLQPPFLLGPRAHGAVPAAGGRGDTHHWLSCMSSVLASELCSSSPRLKTKYSRDSPNCSERGRL